MSAPVRLPRRLPDREPVRSDPPESKADWLRRGIEDCEGVGEQLWVDYAVTMTSAQRAAEVAWDIPKHLRRVPLAELRQRLAALEAEEATP